MVAAVLHLHEGAGVAVDARRSRAACVVFTAMMSPTATRGAARPDSRVELFLVAETRSTSGMAANVSGSVCAAQPVTTMRALGRSRLMRRMVWRAWRTASAVTAQVLTTTASSRSRRRAPDRFQLGDVEPAAEGDDVDAHATPAFRTAPDRTAGEFELDRPGHQHVVVALAPVDGQIAARQRHRHLAVRALEPRGGDRGRAGRRAAGRVSPAPRSQVRMTMCSRETMCASVMLARSGKDRMVFEQRAEPGEIVGIDVVDPEDRVRIAHVHRRRRMQDRLVDRPDLQFDGAGVAEFLGQRNLVPGEARRAHVDREHAVGALPAIENAGAWSRR